MDSDREARLRQEAMAWLTARTHDGARPLSRKAVAYAVVGDPPTPKGQR